MKDGLKEFLIVFTVMVTILAIIKTGLTIYEAHASELLPDDYALERLTELGILDPDKKDIAEAYTVFRGAWGHGSPAANLVSSMCYDYDYYNINRVLDNFEAKYGFEDYGIAFYSISGDLLSSTAWFDQTIVNTPYFIKAVNNKEDLEIYGNDIYLFTMPISYYGSDIVYGVIVFKYHNERTEIQ